MGFRSTMTTEGFSGIEIPQWFKDKHDWFNYGAQYRNPNSPDVFPITLKGESKFYDKFSEDERLLDIQKIIKEAEVKDISVVLLHECGGITLIKITKDSITAREPLTWKEVEKVEHNYCYGCSDSPLTHQELISDKE